jgi:ABC-type dipeptide/oligopeptide/nickel transport system ATPase subunit
MGSTAVISKQAGHFTAEELLAKANEKYNTFHIFVEHDSRKCNADWRETMGNNLIVLQDYKLVASTIAETVLKNIATKSNTSPTVIDHSSAHTPSIAVQPML